MVGKVAILDREGQSMSKGAMSSRYSDTCSAIVAKCGHLLDPEVDGQAVRDTLRRLLTATRTVRGEKLPNGGYAYVQEPDNAVNLVAAVKMGEWLWGKPIAMSVTANLTPPDGRETNPDGFLSAVLEDEKALADTQEMLAKMVAAKRKARPVEIVVSPEKPENPAPPESSSEGFPR